MRAVLGVLMLLGCGALSGVVAPAAQADHREVTVTYRVTLQDPGYFRQAEMTYLLADGRKVRYPTTLDPFVPWEKEVSIRVPGKAKLGIFSDPGGTYLGEIVRDGNVIASNSAYLDPSWTRDAPYGAPAPLAEADLS